MSVTSLIEFDDAAEHDFDAANMELASDKGGLKSQVLSSEVLFANFDEDPLIPNILTSKRGAKTLVLGGLNNTGEVSGGLLSFPNEDQSTATYQNITELTGDFTVRFKAISKIIAPGTPKQIARLISNVDSSQIRWRYQNQGSGVVRIYCNVTNSAGATVADFVVGSVTLAVGTVTNLAVSHDADGSLRMFYNGALVNTIAAPTFNFTNCNLRFGNTGGATETAAANIDNVQLWNAPVLTAAFTYPVAEPTTYVLPTQQMDTKIPLLVDEFLDADIVVEIPSGSRCTHGVRLNEDIYVYDAVAGTWGVVDYTSDLIDQGNSAADLKANLTKMNGVQVIKDIGKVVEIVHFVKSDSGYVTPLIESVTIKYKHTFKSGNIPLCTVLLTVKNKLGEAVENATIWVEGDPLILANTLLGPNGKVNTNAQGKVSVGIPQGITVDFRVGFNQPTLDETTGEESTEHVVFERPQQVIPALPTQSFELLASA